MAALRPLTALFAALGCFMVATLIYTIVTDGSPFRRELLTPWMNATLIDFYVNVVAIAVWVAYNETTWISTVFWVIMLVCTGSIATCFYIVKKLAEVSYGEPVQDPVRHVFLRICTERKMKCSSIVLGKVAFGLLGLLTLATVIYTVVTDGLPFRIELLTPWMAATLIDFYINIFAIAVWVALKESSWIATCFWIILLICFGSITTCAYIVIQLFQLSCPNPVYGVLLDSHAKHAKSTSPK